MTYRNCQQQFTAMNRRIMVVNICYQNSPSLHICTLLVRHLRRSMCFLWFVFFFASIRVYPTNKGSSLISCSLLKPNADARVFTFSRERSTKRIHKNLHIIIPQWHWLHVVVRDWNAKCGKSVTGIYILWLGQRKEIERIQSIWNHNLEWTKCIKIGMEYGV